MTIHLDREFTPEPPAEPGRFVARYDPERVPGLPEGMYEQPYLYDVWVGSDGNLGFSDRFNEVFDEPRPFSDSALIDWHPVPFEAVPDDQQDCWSDLMRAACLDWGDVDPSIRRTDENDGWIVEAGE